MGQTVASAADGDCQALVLVEGGHSGEEAGLMAAAASVAAHAQAVEELAQVEGVVGRGWGLMMVMNLMIDLPMQNDPMVAGHRHSTA
jgi:hypothetical protein